MLLTSGFVDDDIMFACNGSIVCHVIIYFRTGREHKKHNSRDSNEILFSDKRPKYLL